MSEGISREGALTAKFMNEIDRLKSELASVRGEAEFWKADAERTGQLWVESAGSLEQFTHAKEEEIDALKESLKLAWVALGFYAETDNWPYAKKGGCPGERAREARDKLLAENAWLSESGEG